MEYITGISAILTAIATVFLAIYNYQLLKQINKQHESDVFYRAYPLREKSYNELLKSYAVCKLFM